MFAIYLATTVIDSTITTSKDGNAGVIMLNNISNGPSMLDCNA